MSQIALKKCLNIIYQMLVLTSWVTDGQSGVSWHLIIVSENEDPLLPVLGISPLLHGPHLCPAAEVA